MTDRPSVVRGKGISTLCFTPEPATKELAIITTTTSPGTATNPVTIDGVTARRGERRLDDGRYAGWIEVPSRDVAVEVRTRSAETTSRILGSVHLVDTDSRGCTTDPGKLPPTKGAPRQGFVPPGPATISVCYYAGQRRLQASAELTGDDARKLATALNTAPKGRNPDRPADTCDKASDPPGDDAALLIDGTTVRVRFQGCAGRGADNGTGAGNGTAGGDSTIQVSQGIIKMMLEPIHTGYGFSDLPA
jgi:hypothetical protein